MSAQQVGCNSSWQRREVLGVPLCEWQNEEVFRDLLIDGLYGFRYFRYPPVVVNEAEAVDNGQLLKATEVGLHDGLVEVKKKGEVELSTLKAGVRKGGAVWDDSAARLIRQWYYRRRDQTEYRFFR